MLRVILGLEFLPSPGARAYMRIDEETVLDENIPMAHRSVYYVTRANGAKETHIIEIPEDLYLTPALRVVALWPGDTVLAYRD